MIRRPEKEDSMLARATHARLWAAIATVTLTQLGALVSCYPRDTLTAAETEVVVTLFDEQADFATVRSYAMPDTIVHLVADTLGDNIRRDFDDEILAQVESEMAAKGFTRESDPNSADAFMLISA